MQCVTKSAIRFFSFLISVTGDGNFFTHSFVSEKPQVDLYRMPNVKCIVKQNFNVIRTYHPALIPRFLLKGMSDCNETNFPFSKTYQYAVKAFILPKDKPCCKENIAPFKDIYHTSTKILFCLKDVYFRKAELHSQDFVLQRDCCEPTLSKHTLGLLQQKHDKAQFVKRRYLQNCATSTPCWKTLEFFGSGRFQFTVKCAGHS